MEMTGEQMIPAPQQRTWDALNDPEILKACIPGCESIEKHSDTDYEVHMTARVGPVSAKFKGKLSLSDLNPPHSYAIAFEGQGGVAGFGKGSAQVHLATDAIEGRPATKLTYSVKANVGGKLAQIGSRLVDAASKKIAGDFFKAFNEKVAAEQEAADGSADEGHDEHAEPEPVPRDPDLPDAKSSSLAWFAAGALVVFLVALFALYG